VRWSAYHRPWSAGERFLKPFLYIVCYRLNLFKSVELLYAKT
jgi:hypothetical protein